MYLRSIKKLFVIFLSIYLIIFYYTIPYAHHYTLAIPGYTDSNTLSIKGRLYKELDEKDEAKPPIAERLKAILEENPDLNRADKPEKLLEYLNKEAKDILEDISMAQRLDFLRDFLFLGYVTEPLPEDVLAAISDPDMWDGERLERIRIARGIRRKTDFSRMVNQRLEAEGKEGISHAAVSHMEVTKKFKQIRYALLYVTRALKIDPIYILKGKSWKEASVGLLDHEKMYLCRLRKGWPVKKYIDVLEKAGLNFGVESMSGKIRIVVYWEQGEKIPEFEQNPIIREVLGKDSLFREADEKEGVGAAGRGERKLLSGVRNTMIHHFFSVHHREIAGKTPSQILAIFEKYGESVSASGLSAFLKNNNNKAKEFYEVKDEPKRKKSAPRDKPVTGRRAGTRAGAARTETPAEVADAATDKLTPTDLEAKADKLLAEAEEGPDVEETEADVEKLLAGVKKDRKDMQRLKAAAVKAKAVKPAVSLAVTGDELAEWDMMMDCEDVLWEAELLVEWANSPEHKHLIEPGNVKEALQKLVDSQFLKMLEFKPDKERWVAVIKELAELTQLGFITVEDIMGILGRFDASSRKMLELPFDKKVWLKATVALLQVPGVRVKMKAARPVDLGDKKNIIKAIGSAA